MYINIGYICMFQLEITEPIHFQIVVPSKPFLSHGHILDDFPRPFKEEASMIAAVSSEAILVDDDH